MSSGITHTPLSSKITRPPAGQTVKDFFKQPRNERNITTAASSVDPDPIQPPNAVRRQRRAHNSPGSLQDMDSEGTPTGSGDSSGPRDSDTESELSVRLLSQEQMRDRRHIDVKQEDTEEETPLTTRHGKKSVLPGGGNVQGAPQTASTRQSEFTPSEPESHSRQTARSSKETTQEESDSASASEYHPPEEETGTSDESNVE